MKNIALICEYNPMHNGHIYQINKIKKIYPDSNIIAIMSSSFVQRGEPSVLNKFDKARIAVENGIDLVIEMPTIISVQSANFFAYYNILILDKLKLIDYLAFGIEEENEEIFLNTVDNILDNKDSISKLQKKYIDEGLSYKKSYLNALNDLNIDSKILEKPNNTLALQYILALKELNSSIQYFPIHRKEYDNYNNKFRSSTEIRRLYDSGEDYKYSVPKNTYDALINKYKLDDYSELFYYLAEIDKKNPSDTPNYENGMLNLLFKNYTGRLTDSIEKSHNKRYSKSRLQRFVINYILNIKNEDIENLKYINYIRPLQFNDAGASILKEIKEKENIDIIQNISKFTENPINQRFLDIDRIAYKFHNIYHYDLLSKDYTYNPYKK